MNANPYSSIADEIEARVLAHRRHLHRQPALRWEEDESLGWIREQVSAAPTTHFWQQRSEFSGGLVIDMTLDPSLPWRLFRADIDALPIAETTGLPFASCRDGVMHACGHDAHSAILLGAYEAIQTQKIVPAANLRWVWQRAEENPGTPPIAQSGGDRLVEEGVCENMQRANALHIWTETETGRFESCAGPMMANSGRIKIEITCQGGHAATPHDGSNAARLAAQICAALEGFPALVLNPLETVVLEPTIIQTGTASNIRPASAQVWFANRTFLPPDQLAHYERQIEQRIRSVVDFYADASVHIEWMAGHPVLKNDATDVAGVRALLQNAGQNVGVRTPSFGGEDFAHYLRQTPGSMWFLGAHRAGWGNHHTPNFHPDEAAFKKGVLFWLLLASTPLEVS